MTGSGMPMRFSAKTGGLLDVYQAATQMTDESDQSYPFTPNTLLDNALGPLGYYGAFVANMHTDSATTFEDSQLLASAVARNVPVITARQLLGWVDGRNRSSFSNITWSGNQLSFAVAIGAGANGLTGMVPTVGVGGVTLTALTLSGSPVSFTRTTIKGIEYAMFQAAPGTYSATYGAAAAPVMLSATTADSTAGSLTLRVASTSGATTEVVYGTSPTTLDRSQKNAAQGGTREVRLTDLKPSTTYYYRIVMKSSNGSVSTSPVSTVTTKPADSTAPTISAVDAYPLPDGTAAVSWRTNEAADGTLLIGTTPASLTPYDGGADEVSHVVVATKLEPQTRYYYRVKSVDAAGNVRLWPAAGSAPSTFVTPRAGVADRTAVQFRTGTTSPEVDIRQDGLGGVGLVKGQAQGTFTSRVLDAELMVTWDALDFRADLPANSSVALSVRTGSSLTPDSTWTAWKPVGRGGTVGASGRYVQYRVELRASSSGVSPVLRGVGVTHDGARPTFPGES